MKRLLVALLFSTLLTPLTLFAETQTATVLRTTSLLAEPYSDAARVSSLKAKQQVSVLKRKGGWYQVKRGGNTGWLRMSHIRFGDGKAAKADGKGLGQALRFFTTGRSGADGVTVATGIRGLDAADVSNATPDHNAVNKLERYRSSDSNAKNFAKVAGLKSQPLGYIEQK